MAFILWVFVGLTFHKAAGYSKENVHFDTDLSKECDFNQTIFTPEGATVTFLFNRTEGEVFFFRRLNIEKTSGSSQGYRVSLRLYGSFGVNDRHISYDETWKDRTNLSISAFSPDQILVQIDLRNVSMEDNGTYRIRNYHTACYILYVMQMKTVPNEGLQENEPVFVFAHPQASIIKRPLTNATMVWLLDNKPSNQMASFIQQDGGIWISNARRDLHGKIATYRAVQDDGRVTDVNITITVRYGPSLPLTLVPRKTHYQLVSGDTVPDITCTSECNPTCNISWGIHSTVKTLSLGEVKIEDSGEYTCTATRSDGGGQTAWQSISISVADHTDNSKFTLAIACLATVQSLVIIVLGLWAFFMYRRKKPSCCNRLFYSKNKPNTTEVTFSPSHLQGSNYETYEDLQHETRETVRNVYGEVNLSVKEDDVRVSRYENTNVRERNTDVHQH